MAARTGRAVRDDMRAREWAQKKAACCGHTNGWHAVDVVSATYEIRDGELVETEPTRADTVSCHFEGCGCRRLNPALGDDRRAELAAKAAG